MARAQYCPTCVALHGAPGRRLVAYVLKPAAENPAILRCGHCGRTWQHMREGFKRANLEQAELPL